MNFLSHFYFDRYTANPYVVTGTVLPDLIKNADKNWNLHPEKKADLFNENEALGHLLIGWQRHLAVDLAFHSSAFFTTKTNELKQQLIPLLDKSPVRPSFLAHIGIELLLDHLLIVQGKINVHQFYHHLEQVSLNHLGLFITKCGITHHDHFFKFYNSFKSSRYLFSYQKIENISYALQRICMRLWEHPFAEKTLNELTFTLDFYKKDLEADFMVIFDEIEKRLL